jgi:anti-sigma factor RsiW
MNCPIENRESAELLMDFCSGKVEPAAAAVLEGHIEVCPACREFTSHQRAVWQALDGWEAPPVSADFDRRLYRRIEKEVSWWEMFIRPFRPMLFRQGLPITAAAAVVLVASVLLDRPSVVPVPTPPESAQVEAVAPEQAETALQEMELMRELNALVHADTENPKL